MSRGSSVLATRRPGEEEAIMTKEVEDGSPSKKRASTPAREGPSIVRRIDSRPVPYSLFPTPYSLTNHNRRLIFPLSSPEHRHRNDGAVGVRQQDRRDVDRGVVVPHRLV